VSDAEGMAAMAHADLAVIATDTARHVGDAVQALELGARRVLVEKPVAPSAADAMPLLSHPRAGRVYVAAPLRAHECFSVVRNVLAELGSPLASYVYCQSWLPDWRTERDFRQSYSARADEGGVLRDLIHEIDYAAVLFGSPVGVSAALTWDGPLDIESEQAALLLWRTELATVTVRLDYITRPNRRGLLATGPDATVEWDVVGASVRLTRADGNQVEELRQADLDRDTVMARQARAALELAPDEDPEILLAAGAPATLEQGSQAVQICDDARAADLGRAVR
jgi:predicted dehydrogenase